MVVSIPFNRFPSFLPIYDTMNYIKCDGVNTFQQVSLISIFEDYAQKRLQKYVSIPFNRFPSFLRLSIARSIVSFECVNTFQQVSLISTGAL